MEQEPWLKDIFVFLAAASLVVPIFHRARIGAVLGFLLIGIACGPYGVGRFAAEHPWLRYVTIEDRARVDLFGEIGVVALLFLVGLELSLPRLWSLRRYVFGIGGAQVLGCTVLIGIAAALLGAPGPAAVILGLSLAMSSTAMVMQLLDEQGRTATALGQVALSVLLFQDLMVAPILSLAGVLGQDGMRIAIALGTAVLQGGAAVVAVVVLGRFVLRPLLRFTGSTGSRELIMATTVVIVAVVAGLMHSAGLSFVLGAFLAGLLLSETEYRHQIEVDLEPFKGLLLGVFFVSVGMTVDLAAVWERLGWILLGAAALVLIKAAVLFAAARAFRLGWGMAAEVAVLLAQGGEFAFVVLGLARTNGIVSADLAQAVVAVVATTMLASPLLAFIGRRIGERAAHRDHAAHMPGGDAGALKDHVVIGGYGRVGQLIGKLLDEEHVAYVALETDGEVVAEHRRAGRPVFFGDAGRAEMLRRAGAEGARAFVVTVNSRSAAERMVKAVLKHRREACVVARAADTTHAERLTQLGAVGVVPEAVEASLQLGARVLEAVGVDDGAIALRLDRVREETLGRIQAAAR